MDPIKTDMFEQLMMVFSKSTRLRNQVPQSSPVRAQCNEVMDGIIKLNKVINRINTENYVKRGKHFIDLINSIDRSLNDNELKKEIEIIPVATEQIKPTSRGGARKGAGRKSLGIKKPVSITLPPENWKEIDNLIQTNEFASYADFVRSAIFSYLSKY